MADKSDETEVSIIPNFININKKLDLECICRKALIYQNRGDDENMHKYYLYAIQHKYIKGHYLYGTWYKNIEKNQEKMVYHFKLAIILFMNNDYYITDKKDSENLIIKMMEILGVYYDNISFPTEEDTANIFKYYEMAIKYGSVVSMYNLGHYYYEKKNYDKMLQYYLMAIEQNDVDTMYELALYYQNNKEYDKMREYYVKAVNLSYLYKDNNTLLNDGIIYFNLFNLKDELESIENKSIGLKCKLKEINNKADIRIYNNKKILFERLNNIVECGICYETLLNIDLHCGHICCIKCYSKLYSTSCPFCRL